MPDWIGGVNSMKRTGKLWRRVSACVLAVSMLCSMACFRQRGAFPERKSKLCIQPGRAFGNPTGTITVGGSKGA